MYRLATEPGRFTLKVDFLSLHAHTFHKIKRIIAISKYVFSCRNKKHIN